MDVTLVLPDETREVRPARYEESAATAEAPTGYRRHAGHPGRMRRQLFNQTDLLSLPYGA